LTNAFFKGVSDLPYVNSSAITRIEWENNTLTIWFTGNAVGYDYYGVPEHVYLDFLNAHSIGQYYNDYIKDQY